jgi:hypothetical protein
MRMVTMSSWTPGIGQWQLDAAAYISNAENSGEEDETSVMRSLTTVHIGVPCISRCYTPPVHFETDLGHYSCESAQSTAMKIDFPIISAAATL